MLLNEIYSHKYKEWGGIKSLGSIVESLFLVIVFDLYTKMYCKIEHYCYRPAVESSDTPPVRSGPGSVPVLRTRVRGLNVLRNYTRLNCENAPSERGSRRGQVCDTFGHETVCRDVSRCLGCRAIPVAVGGHQEVFARNTSIFADIDFPRGKFRRPSRYAYRIRIVFGGGGVRR